MEEHEYLQQLIDEKDFSALDENEVKLVLAYLSREEYDQRRAMVKRFKTGFSLEKQMVIPNASTRKLLLERMDKRSSKNSFWLFLINYRMPLYQPALALLVLVFFLMLWPKTEKGESQIVYKESAPKTIYDTIVQVKEVPTIVTVDKIKYKTVTKVVSPTVGVDLVEMEQQNASMLNALNNSSNLPFANSRLEEELNKVGKSSDEQTELSKFLVISN